MFLTKDQKKELRDKGVFYYSSTTYLFIKTFILLSLFYTVASSFKLISKKLLDSSNLNASFYINEIGEYIIFTALTFLIAAVCFTLLSSKFYLVSFRFKPQFKLPFSIFAGLKGLFFSFISIITTIVKIGVIVFLITWLSGLLRLSDFSSNIISDIIKWYNTSYWQVIVICCIIFSVNFILTYIYFNFKHYFRFKDK